MRDKNGIRTLVRHRLFVRHLFVRHLFVWDICSSDTCSSDICSSKTFVRPTLVRWTFVRLRNLLFAALSFTTNIIISRNAQRGCWVGVASLEKNFRKKSQMGDQGKIYPLPPSSIFKKFKRKPQRGYQRIFWLESRKALKRGPKEIFWSKFRNVSQKCFLWSPLWDFNRISAIMIFV